MSRNKMVSHKYIIHTYIETGEEDCMPVSPATMGLGYCQGQEDRLCSWSPQSRPDLFMDFMSRSLVYGPFKRAHLSQRSTSQAS